MDKASGKRLAVTRERDENQFGLVWFCLLEMVMCASSETTFLVLLF